MANTHSTMSAEKFKTFFDSISSSVAKGQGTNKSLLELMQENGVKMELPPEVSAQLKPLLEKPIPTKAQLAHAKIPHNCTACGACGVCHLCGELNFGAGGAHAASIWHILDVTVGNVSVS